MSSSLNHNDQCGRSFCVFFMFGANHWSLKLFFKLKKKFFRFNYNSTFHIYYIVGGEIQSSNCSKHNSIDRFCRSIIHSSSLFFLSLFCYLHAIHINWILFFQFIRSYRSRKVYFRTKLFETVIFFFIKIVSNFGFRLTFVRFDFLTLFFFVSIPNSLLLQVQHLLVPAEDHQEQWEVDEQLEVVVVVVLLDNVVPEHHRLRQVAVQEQHKIQPECGISIRMIHPVSKCKLFFFFGVVQIKQFSNMNLLYLFFNDNSGPVPVLVMSLAFIASVFMLHIWGKYTRSV